MPSKSLEPQETSAPLKKRKDGYERKPRHKTRTDRYEHKTGRSKEGKQSSRKETVKRSKRNRKDTLNENFHASNVTQNRLTLYSCPDMGIFQKGKSSSPVKPSELPDLSFSEMNFLCRRPQPSACNRLNSRTEMMPNEELRLQKQTLSNFMNASHQSTETNRDNKLSPDLIKPIRMESPTGSVHIPLGRYANEGSTELALQNSPLRSKQDRTSEVHKGEGSSRSATPYSWSVSEQQEPPVDPSFENYVNSLVFAGLDGSGQRVEDKQTKRYWDLEDLKRLLEERKRLWDSASRNSCATDTQSLRERRNRYSSGQREMELALPQPANRHKATGRGLDNPSDTHCGVSKGDDNANSRDCSLSFAPRDPVVDLSTNDQPRNKLLEDSLLPVGAERQPFDGCTSNNPIFPFFPEISRHWDSSQERHSSNPVCSNHFPQCPTHNGDIEVENPRLSPETKLACLISLPCLNATEFKFEDDDGLFLQVLDAAYNDIVHSKNSIRDPQSNSVTGIPRENGDGADSTGLARRSHLTVPTIPFPDQRPVSGSTSQNFKQSAYLLSAPTCRGNSLLGCNDAISTRLQVPASACQPSYTDDFCALGFPTLQQRRLEPDTNTTILGLNHTPCEAPPGFWRQNRLY